MFVTSIISKKFAYYSLNQFLLGIKYNSQVSHSGSKTTASKTFSSTVTAHLPPQKRRPDIMEIVME